MKKQSPKGAIRKPRRERKRRRKGKRKGVDSCAVRTRLMQEK